MSIRLAVPKEKTQTERRVALLPETVARLIKKGFQVAVEKGAGVESHFSDESYGEAGATLVSAQEIFKGAQIVVKVQPPNLEEVQSMEAGSLLISFMNPHQNQPIIKMLQEKKIITFAMEMIPRVTRAQAMDALSSQATVAGYKAALLAAGLSGRFFPMLTTAAGTIRPAKVLVMGAGVAGLQAIATTRRLGAVVEGYDVRAAVKEQVESLGAKFVELAVNAEAKGGYARELTDEEKLRQKELVAAHVSRADVVITTAQIPGRPAPQLISKEMVEAMRPGSVIVDLAAESGGNCALTKASETVNHNGVIIFGPVNLPSQLPQHASEMYSKNLLNLLMLLTKEGQSLELDWNDEIIAGSALTGGRA